MQTATVKIAGMTCRHCRDAVRQALMDLTGMVEAEVKLEEGRAWVSFDETRVSLKDIYAAIEEAGYTVKKT